MCVLTARQLRYRCEDGDTKGMVRQRRYLETTRLFSRVRIYMRATGVYVFQVEHDITLLLEVHIFLSTSALDPLRPFDLHRFFLFHVRSKTRRRAFFSVYPVYPVSVYLARAATKRPRTSSRSTPTTRRSPWKQAECE